MDEDKTKEYLVKVKIEAILEVEISFTDELTDNDPKEIEYEADERLREDYDIVEMVKSYEVLKWSPDKKEHIKTNIKIEA